MKIKVLLTIYNSKRDRAGNCYWAFRWIDTESGKEVVGTISGGQSNILAAYHHYNGDWDGYRYTVVELGIRDFNRQTKEWPYAGCAPKEIANFVRKQVESANAV